MWERTYRVSILSGAAKIRQSSNTTLKKLQATFVQTQLLAKLGHLERPNRTSRLFGQFALQQRYLRSEFVGFGEPLISHPSPPVHGPSPPYSRMAAIAQLPICCRSPERRFRRFAPLVSLAGGGTNLRSLMPLEKCKFVWIAHVHLGAASRTFEPGYYVEPRALFDDRV